MSVERRIARRLRALIQLPVRGAVVLAYHRIAEPESVPGGDPFGICVTPAAFADQMAMLARVGRPVHLEEIATRLRSGASLAGLLAVTFDDGYADVAEVALPVLERHGIPATVFFVSGNTGGPFWWDRLTALLARADANVPFRVAEVGAAIAWKGGPPRELRYQLHRRFRVMMPEARQQLLDHLESIWGPPVQGDLPRAMDAAEARRLVEHKLIAAGAHSVSHPPLAEIRSERSRGEIETSRAELSQRLGRPITAFSYPHGSTSPAVQRTVADAGFELACTSVVGAVHSASGPLALPRLWMRSHGAVAFALRLRPYLEPALGTTRGRQ